MINESVKAVRFPFNFDPVVIGGLLTHFSFLFAVLGPYFWPGSVLTWIFLNGYYVRVLRSENEVPRFEDWISMFVRGSKVFAVVVLYMFIPVGSLVYVTTNPVPESRAFPAKIVVSLSGILFITLIYVLPASLALFSETGSLRKSFDTASLKRVLGSGEYFVRWVIGVGIIFCGGFMSWVISLTPTLGFFLSSFVSFYFNVAGFWVLGRAYRKAEEG